MHQSSGAFRLARLHYKSATGLAPSKTWRKRGRLWPTRQRFGVRRSSAAFNGSERAEFVRFMVRRDECGAGDSDSVAAERVEDSWTGSGLWRLSVNSAGFPKRHRTCGLQKPAGVQGAV